MISRSSLSVRWAIGGVAIFIVTAFLLLRGQHRSYKSQYESIVKSMHHTKLFDDVYNSTLGVSTHYQASARFCDVCAACVLCRC